MGGLQHSELDPVSVVVICGACGLCGKCVIIMTATEFFPFFCWTLKCESVFDMATGLFFSFKTISKMLENNVLNMQKVKQMG